MASPSQLAQELAGKRAVVTGASRGIGRAIALELAAAGADVVVHWRQSKDDAEAVAEQAARLGVRAPLCRADLALHDDRMRFVDAAWTVMAGCDIWINNAGADILTGETAKLSFQDKLQLLWAVDVCATVHLSREIAHRMKANGGGLIVNMGWDQAETGMEGDSGQLFGTVKAAVMAFSKSLAVSVAPTVRVNCVAPGWVRTAWGEQASDSWQQRVLRETPLGRWGTPEDIAGAVRFLCSPAGEFITGQVIRINGGAVR